jgi:hypothetical protein
MFPHLKTRKISLDPLARPCRAQPCPFPTSYPVNGGVSAEGGGHDGGAAGGVGTASREIVGEFGPVRFGQGLLEALRVCGLVACV